MEILQFQVQAREGIEIRRTIYIQVYHTDYITPKLGVGNQKASLRYSGGANATSTNNVTEFDATNHPGIYKLILTAAEIKTKGRVIVTADTGGGFGQSQVDVVGFDPFADGAASKRRQDIQAGMH